MKIFWLSPSEFAAALILAVLIAIVYTYVIIPHPVETPVQIITPVPTPAPIISSPQSPVTNYGIMTIGENSGSYTTSTVITNFGIVTYTGNCPSGFTGTMTNKAGGIDKYTNWCGTVNS
jgi:hypothetical protein